MRQSEEEIRLKVSELIGRLPEDTAAARRDLFAKLRALFKERFPHHLDALENVISALEPPSPSLTSEKGEIMPEIEPKRSRAPLVLGILVIAALAAGGGWYAWQSQGGAQDFDHGITGYSVNAETLEQMADSPGKATPKKDGGDNILQANGPLIIYAIDPTTVDTSKKYRVKARIRVTQDDPAKEGSAFYVGVATYDAAGKLQTEPPGAHRYAAAVNRILKSEEGWVDLEGEITGTGNQSPNQFREGTKAVRPVVALNFGSSGAISEITSLSIEEVKR